MKSSLFACLVLLISAQGAVAQEDPMAVQRCVWSCLANSPGASSPEYDQCVTRHCVGFDQPNAAEPTASDWLGGLASDGVHRFATTRAEQGYAFTYFCAPGQSFFTLNDIPIPPGQYRFLIGTTEYIVPFDLSRGVLSVNIPPGSPFMAGIRAGTGLMSITDMQRVPVIRFSLTGADRIIGEAVAACFP